MPTIAILYDAGQAVLSTFELDEVLNQILAMLRDYFHLKNGAIMLLDTEKQELFVRAHFGRGPESNVRLPVGTGLTGTAAKLKRPIYAPDVSQDPRYVGYVKGTKSELAIPLMVRNEVVGVLDCQSEQINFFDTDTVDLLTLFATQASIALQNAKLYSLEQHRAKQLEAINTIARQTTAVVNMDDLLTNMVKLVQENFPADHVAILLWEDGQLVLRAQGGKLTPVVTPGTFLPPGAGLGMRALESGKPVVENNVKQSPYYVAGFKETESEMCLPLISFGERVGVLTIESAQRDHFQNTDIGPLEAVADICANAIQTAGYIERMRQMAYVDGLTGIFNRRFFEMRILEEIERAARYGAPMSVVMVDIDHFKRLNDEFGHLLGDEVLRQVSSIFMLQLRKADVLCRYGGEEFAIIVPEANLPGAHAIADKLRRMVETFPFPGVPRPVTISLGVSQYPLHGVTRDEIVKAADLALYSAKQAGRNRVIAWRGTAETAQ